MTRPRDLRDAIVDTAVTLAARSSWEAVRFFDIATELNISLDDIRAHFREKEDLIDAWFDRIDGVMLKVAQQDDFRLMSSSERLHCLIMAWLDAMTEHRGVVRQMIGSKLEPGHIHIQVPAVMRISRTVQWMREAAQRDGTFLRRALEETALTTIYLATFTHWMFDESPQSQRTRDFLTHKLQLAETLDHTIYGAGQPHADDSANAASTSATETRLFPPSTSAASPTADPLTVQAAAEHLESTAAQSEDSIIAKTQAKKD